jgi:hypothetical protein
VRSFKENQHALDEWERCLAEDRAALSEMQARGDGTDYEIADLAAAIREGSGKVTHHKRMDEKRKSVAGFYVPARAVYSRKLAEARALAQPQPYPQPHPYPYPQPHPSPQPSPQPCPQPFHPPTSYPSPHPRPGARPHCSALTARRVAGAAAGASGLRGTVRLEHDARPHGHGGRTVVQAERACTRRYQGAQPRGPGLTLG